MESLYEDPGLTAGYLHLMELSHTASQDHSPAEMDGAAEETYFESLIARAYESLQQISQQALPELHLHAWRAELDTRGRSYAETAITDERGIHVGLRFVSRLDAAILVLSAYLMENYLWQVSPLVLEAPPTSEVSSTDDAPLTLYTGNVPSIAKVVRLDDFPAEALSLYAAHLIPQAEARDGYQKRPFQLVMEHLQQMRLAAHRRDDDHRALARAVPKPLLDPVDFFDRFDVDETMRAYLDPDKGPYLLRLHLQLLLDGLYFVLGHEVAHYTLHLEHREATAPQMRKDEAVADSASLELLGGIPGFQPRSLIILFNFARSQEPALPPNLMHHPLARNRLMVLAETLLAGPSGDALRADVNAGLALLPSRFRPQYLTFGWPDGAPEDVDIYISSYADLDYTAHIMVYIDRPLRSAEVGSALWENAFLLAHLAYKIWFEVRDPVDPETVYAWGGAGYHPTVRPEDMFNSNRAETVFSRLHFSIPAPAEFCLKWPGAEFTVRKIEVFYHEPDLRGSEEQRNQVRFFYEPVELDLSDYLESRPALWQDPTLRRRLLLAARRYLDYDRCDESIQIYQWLYRQEPESLPYGDLVNLAAQLMDFDRFAEAAEVARRALGPGRMERPRFHYVLGCEHIIREEPQEAYEEMFLEMALFGMYGDMFDSARELCGEIAAGANDPVMAALRVFMAHRDRAGQALQRGERRLALAEFQAGRDALLTHQPQAHRDFVFLRQLLSDVTLAICQLEGSGFERAAEAAQAVFLLRPDFVPALMNLARIALLQGNRNAAHALWQKAYAVAPFHSIVFDSRAEFEHEPS
jgi:hypothetical protein